MQQLKKIISNNKNLSLILVLYFFIHLALMNINFAEWGDSYRILRASEYIRNFSYPEDEKRPPLFSILLAVRPSFADQVVWGRFLMFIITSASLYVFYKLLQELKLKKKEKELALVLFILNPVYLYWSLRIMADVPFSLLSLTVLYLMVRWKNNLGVLQGLVLGFLLGLSVLTRFEGYILGLSVGLALLIVHIKKEKALLSLFSMYASVFTGFVLTAGFWFIYRNPLSSSYFEEPQGRAYDFNMVIIYLVSLAFSLGFVYALPLIRRDKLKVEPPIVSIVIFVVLELFLALAWPAAIPRLFTPIIPFLCIFFAVQIVQYFSSAAEKYYKEAFILGLSLVIYAVAQYFLKLQFLVLIKTMFGAVILLNLVIGWSLLKRKYRFFLITLVISLVIWSFSTIYLHKDIFKPVVMANRYITSELEGKIAYNDVSSVSDWYLNQSSKTDGIEGTYVNMDTKEGRSFENLKRYEIDYVLITNEHNTDMEYSEKETKHLVQIKEFRYTIRGKDFFTKILKFEENYGESK